MSNESKLKRVIIDPVTRVEGHGKVSLLLDEENRVTRARFHIVEFRGFEKFIQGRPYWEVPVTVQRLCGICPVSHHLCAAKAMDRIVGVDEVSPTAEKVRRLMHYGQIFQSHALHFFHLAAPDLLFGFDSDPAKRNIVGIIETDRDLATQAVLMRKYGQEVIRVTAGKKVHGTGAVPGGVNKNVSAQERDFLKKDLEQLLEWSRKALSIARDYTLKNFDEIKDFGSFPSNHMGLVGPDGALDLYEGRVRVVDAEGAVVEEGFDIGNYTGHLAEEVRSWSYMKFPFLKKLGPERGWYRVGPLARLNTASHIDTPEAEAARVEFAAVTEGKPNNVTLAYHWARMIELLHSAEKMAALLDDADLQGDELVRTGERRAEAAAVIEAPRGTLIHHYRVNDRDQITMANLIVSTTHNNEAMNQAVRRVAEDHVSGKPKITEGMLNHIEVAIRAYDPCLSCATHALGRMPLVVTLEDETGRVLDRRVSA